MAAEYPKQRGVFERPPGSGVWWISHRGSDGKRHRQKVGRYEAAVGAYCATKQRIREGSFQAPRASGVTFKELVDEAFADRKARIAGSTSEGDGYKKPTLLAWFGSLPAAKVTAAMIRDRLGDLRGPGVSGATSNRYHALVSAILRWGVEAGKPFKNPARDVPRYHDSEARVRFLDASEEAALRKVIREDYPEEEAELDLALHTGMRRNELYRLTWDHVDLQRGILTVEGKQHANSRKSSRRFLKINSRARLALTELYGRSNGSPYVCPGAHAGTETDRDWRDWFEASIRQAKIDNFVYHDLRHTFASRLVMAGVPLAAVMEMLGHRSIAMTMRYAHLRPTTSGRMSKNWSPNTRLP
jgi:integrase